MGLLPDLGRLSLRPCPTGVDPPPRNAARTEGEGTPARDAVVTDNDLLVLILTALNDGARDDACQQVQRWCATHKGACDDETWRRVRDLLFPIYRDSAPLMRPKHHLLWLCRRWNRGRYDRYHAATAAANARGDLVVPMPSGSHFEKEHDQLQYKAIEAFLLNAHRHDMDEEGDHEHNRPPVFEGWDVYWFCAWAFEFNTEPLKWAVEAGYIHLGRGLAGPTLFWTYNSEWPRFYHGEPYCFFAPRTLLGLAILWPMSGVLEKVQFVLDLGVDPNGTGIEPYNFVRGDVLVKDDVLRPEDEGGIEGLALYHIVTLLYNTHRYTGTYYKRHERAYPGLMNMGQDIKPLYALLHKYGAEMYKASLMYRAYYWYTQNPVLLEYAKYLGKLANGMWLLLPVPKKLSERLIRTALERARARFPYIKDVAFDEKGDLKDFSFVVYEWHQDGSKSEAK